MSMEHSYSTLQEFESSSHIRNEKSDTSGVNYLSERLPFSQRSSIPNRFSDMYDFGERLGSMDQVDPLGSFSTNLSSLTSGYAGGSQSMNIGDGIHSYSHLYGNRNSLFSDNSDFGAFEQDPYSCTGNDFVNSEYERRHMSFGDSLSGCSFSKPHSSTGFESDFLMKPQSDLNGDSFLFNSQMSSPPSKPFSTNAPPLPPRNYMQGEYLTNPPPLPPRANNYNSLDAGYPPPSSARSSASLSSPRAFPLWNRSLADVVETPSRQRRISSQLTASAPPFVANGASSKKEDEKKESVDGKEKKGSGDDVDINKLISGEETRTAVMIRNIPNRFSKEELCDILDQFVMGKYTILNMPLDSKTHRNLGYSFIQFHTIQDLITVYKELQGKNWPKSESVKRCRFCYAKIQGDPNTPNVENGEVVKEV